MIIVILPGKSDQSSDFRLMLNTNAGATSSALIPRTLSLPSPLVHHPPLKKGDTHHLVSLTSTTYGSLLLIDHPNTNPNLEGFDHPTKSITLIETKPSSPDSVINTWELMEGLDDFDRSVKPISSSVTSVFDRSYTFQSVSTESSSSKKTNTYTCYDKNGSVKKLCNSFKPVVSVSENSNSNSSSNSNQSMEGKVKSLCNSFEAVKLPSSTTVVAGVENLNSNSFSNSNLPSRPLWKHMSEEYLLAEMDSNVVSSFRQAISSKQLALSQSRTAKSVGSNAMVPRIRLPGTENKIVLYFTSLRGIRRTYEDCCAVRMIFRGFRVPVDERDISMDSAYRKELQSTLGEKTVTLPKVFIRGKYVGGADEIKQLHEVGELAKLLEGFPVQDPVFVCKSCGDARFVPCLSCNGSRKLYEEEEEKLRRCPECNENGLIRCPYCCS